ncbi:MAG: hypothetical protein JSU72_01120 [Deltaproteobacteria bacterium]|nr:MAG: hypothetical protein JSU72_01120 [Deltaproteobacteria bacterium]
MVYNKLGYCNCGFEVWIEYLWNGKEWTHRFSDLNVQEITQCPDCGEELREDDLEA